MQYIVVSILAMIFSSTISAAQADDGGALQQSQATDTTSSVTPKPGPFLTERIALLKAIQESKNKGIGVQSYMAAFLSLEGMVENGASKVNIQVRIDSIKSALEDQLLWRQRCIESKTVPVERPTLPDKQIEIKLMTLATARLYMLRLVNADRAKYHLSRLTLDATASAAGQAHCDQMAVADYCAHWDLSGKKPWQRYTEAGGVHCVGENLASFGASFGEVGLSGGLKLAKDPMFSPEVLQQMESSFMSERPPYDGHRAQILAPEHNKLGVGVSCTVNPVGLSRVCLAQEFINEYGQYSRLPKTIVLGKPFEVSGCLFPGVKLYSVLVDWEPAPKPMSREELRATYSCGYGDYVMANIYIENQPDLKLSTKGGRQHFSVQITPTKDWKPGLYHVEILAMLPNAKAPIIVSTRTVSL